MFELFAIGTFWFWALLVTELVLLFLFTNFEYGAGATVSVLAFCAALQFFGGVNIVGAVGQHWYFLLPVGAAYLLLGTGWGIFKWRRFIKLRLAEYDKLFAKFVASKKLPAGTTQLPDDMKLAWASELENHYEWYGSRRVYLSDVPQASDNKARITQWMAYWPFSVLLYFLKDLVIEVFTAVYNRVAGHLQRIADTLYAGRNIKDNLPDNYRR